MNKYVVHYRPGFYGESFSVIHVFADSVQEAKDSVLQGVGFRQGKRFIPKEVIKVEEIY